MVRAIRRAGYDLPSKKTADVERFFEGFSQKKGA
jgi:hypothetical protein